MRDTLIIQNLKCGGCAYTITTKLSKLKNVSNVEVDVDNNTISFNYLHNKDLEAVKNKLKDLGYPSIDEENTFTSKAKSFVSCATGKFLK